MVGGRYFGTFAELTWTYSIELNAIVFFFAQDLFRAHGSIDQTVDRLMRPVIDHSFRDSLQRRALLLIEKYRFNRPCVQPEP